MEKITMVLILQIISLIFMFYLFKINLNYSSFSFNPKDYDNLFTIPFLPDDHCDVVLLTEPGSLSEQSSQTGHHTNILPWHLW